MLKFRAVNNIRNEELNVTSVTLDNISGEVISVRTENKNCIPRVVYYSIGDKDYPISALDITVDRGLGINK